MKKIGRIFSLIFFISFITLLLSIAYNIFKPVSLFIGNEPLPPEEPIESNVPTEDTESDISGIVAFVSLITSTTSAIGVASTTLISWRKESRESRKQELENNIREMEAEKLRRELQKPNNSSDQ